MSRTSAAPLTLILSALAFLALTPVAVQAQATSRTCAGQAGETPGPACLVAHQDLGGLPQGPLYWSIYTFADARAAERAKPPHGAVVQAFGRVWLFDVGGKGGELEGGRHLVDVGPLPIETAQGDFGAEYLKSTFAPGATAPVHVHSGPEAFYAISGASCLETPDGVQVARGAGHSLMVRRGPPMLLMAIGQETRQGFALILDGEGGPPTTLTSAWTPKGLCPKD
uniref:Cupin type-2 domain-containing protein n=1 Tax=Caulobacter sp. (strain K31) TaxID=366602 RepID=B0T858_CAUSK